MEGAGLSVEDLPLLAKSIRIVHDLFTVTGNVVPRLVRALAALLINTATTIHHTRSSQLQKAKLTVGSKIGVVNDATAQPTDLEGGST
jgi:hypothetical protein